MEFKNTEKAFQKSFRQWINNVPVNNKEYTIRSFYYKNKNGDIAILAKNLDNSYSAITEFKYYPQLQYNTLFNEIINLEIYSVQRNSDEEVFTIGDVIDNLGEIDGFIFNNISDVSLRPNTISVSLKNESTRFKKHISEINF